MALADIAVASPFNHLSRGVWSEISVDSYIRTDMPKIKDMFACM